MLDRTRAALAAMLALAVALAAAGAARAQAPKPGGTLRAALRAEVSTYDPHKGASGTDHMYLYPVFDTLVRFARGARVLIHDAMYTGTEYMEHRGWGHSSYRDAVEFAIAAAVETLVLFHHDPDRTDDDLDEQVSLCRAMVAERGGDVRIVAAAEGMELEV